MKRLLLLLVLTSSLLPPLIAQEQVSLRSLAPYYGVRTEFLDDTLNLLRHLDSVSYQNHVRTDTCVSINARLLNMSNSLQYDFRHTGDTLWIDEHSYATGYNAFIRQLSVLSRIALQRAYHYIERDVAIVDSIQKSSLNQHLDTIRRNHRLIVNTCDGIGIKDKSRQKELKDIYYAYLSIYNRYDMTLLRADSAYIDSLSEFIQFQNDLITDMLGNNSFSARISNFTNTLRIRCGRSHSEVLRSYQRVFGQTADPVTFSTIPQYYDYARRQNDILRWQEAYLTAVELREKITANNERIVKQYSAGLRQVAETYNEVAKGVNTIPAFTNNEEADLFIGRLEEFQKVQQCYLDDYQRILSISSHGDSIIRACSMRYSDIAKAYRQLSASFVTTPTYRSLDEAEHHKRELLNFQTLQRQYDTVLRMRQQLDRGRDSIGKHWMSHMTLYNGYQTIRKQFASTPTFINTEDGSAFIRHLQQHIDIQQLCMTAIVNYNNSRILDDQVSAVIRPFINIKKGYNLLKATYLTIKAINHPDDLALYNQQLVAFATIQQATLKTARSPEAAETERRMEGVIDPDKLEIILGL